MFCRRQKCILIFRNSQENEIQDSAGAMVPSSLMVFLAELSHVASLAAPFVTSCLLMLGFLLCLGELTGVEVDWEDVPRQTFLSKLFSSQQQNVTNVKPIDLFVGVTEVCFLRSYQCLYFTASIVHFKYSLILILNKPRQSY